MIILLIAFLLICHSPFFTASVTDGEEQTHPDSQSALTHTHTLWSL